MNQTENSQCLDIRALTIEDLREAVRDLEREVLARDREIATLESLLGSVWDDGEFTGEESGQGDDIELPW